ncbi:MAG: LysR family transcriptional regulator [Kofleriaceae bacterium]|nr:LysR family transcriptional regulator [Kofleriaceae bacterium]
MDLNRAASFVRVVETGGFTRAAKTLGVPASSVSRSVAKLEDELGVTLLERTTRSITLTDAGRAFFERARDALVGLDEASDLAIDAAQQAHGVVRVAAPPDFGSGAGPLFAEFAHHHPRVRVELTMTTRGAELVGDLVDLALVIGKLPDSSLMARKLGDSVQRLYAAPAYLAKRGKPKRLADLAEHDAIVVRGTGSGSRWELMGPRGREHVDVNARLIADHVFLVRDAAIAGLGIVLLPSMFGDASVARGDLARVLDSYSLVAPLHLLMPAARHLPRRVALLRDFLAERLTARCKEHGNLEA